MRRFSGVGVPPVLDDAAADARPTLPTTADTVIVGAGVIGCAVANHLASLPGAGSVVVIEKAMVSHGASWHAAGLLNQLRGTKLYVLL